MNVFNQILAMMFCLGLAVALSVCVMVYGWGVTPKSWYWIIGGGLFGQTLLQILIKAASGEYSK